MKLCVIYYHEIVKSNGWSYQKKQLDSFEKEMKYLYDNNDRFSVISFDDYLKDRYDPKKINIIISFDDGFRSIFLYAHPVLSKYNFKYTIYLATGFVNKKDYLSLEEIKYLKDSGIVDFEAHTHNHINCKKASNKNIMKEIELSDCFFINNIEYFPRIFCYPYGKFNFRTESFLKKNGRYEMMLGSYYGFIHNKSKKTLPRVGITNEDSLSLFAKKISGKYNWKGFLQKIRTLFLKKY